MNIVGEQLGPEKKLAVIVAATRELFDTSDAERIFKALLAEAAALELDATMFSNLAATALRPAGLLNGTTALAATTGGGEAAMLGDLEKLAGSIAANINDPVIIAHSRQALALRIRRGADLDIPMFSTRAVAPGTIIMLDPANLAYAFGVNPIFETGNEMVLHFEETNPQQISTPGNPNPTGATLSLGISTTFRCFVPPATQATSNVSSTATNRVHLCCADRLKRQSKCDIQLLCHHQLELLADYF